jgi:phospholipid/cholesterol/gamma-HCH transport system permease protein
MPSEESVTMQAQLDMRRLADGGLVVGVSGGWRLRGELPAADQVFAELEKEPKAAVLSFDSTALSGWDSGLLIFLLKLSEYCSRSNIAVDRAGLPGGVRRLLELASAVPEKQGTRKETLRFRFMSKVADSSIDLWSNFLDVLGFLGEAAVSFGRLFTGKARFRGLDLWITIQECGADALPIVTLISILVGLIFAFVGSIQLKTFGAQIYIADLVGIAMSRAMGAIMTGIIMAGRTGASFAATIGTMQVNEEIDALKTSGIPPMDFLVLPRIIALALMMPLLTIYSDLMGILGGMVVGVAGFDISVREYYNETISSLTLTNICIGVVSGFVFGILVAFAGCLKGMQCGRSASAVGNATTSAVVMGIVSIIVATAIITVVCNVFGL